MIPVPGNGAIRLTTARFMTPTGRQIQGKGIEPDLAVMPLKLERLGQLDRHREVDLRGALKNTDPTAARGEPASSLSSAATAISAVSEDSSATTSDIGPVNPTALHERALHAHFRPTSRDTAALFVVDYLGA